MPYENIKAQRGASPVVTIGDVRVSASLSESHELTSDVTSSPVEGKIDTNDHIYKKPRVVSIDGKVSDVVIENGYPGKSLVESFRVGNENNPAIEAWHTVKSYWDESKIIDIETSLETLPSMAIVKFSVTRGPGESTTVLRFSVTAKQLNVVATQTTAALTLPEPKSNTVKGKAEGKGKKPNKNANEAQDTKAKQSTLSRLAGGVTGFLGF